MHFFKVNPGAAILCIDIDLVRERVKVSRPIKMDDIVDCSFIARLEKSPA